MNSNIEPTIVEEEKNNSKADDLHITKNITIQKYLTTTATAIIGTIASLFTSILSSGIAFIDYFNIVTKNRYFIPVLAVLLVLILSIMIVSIARKVNTLQQKDRDNIIQKIKIKEIDLFSLIRSNCNSALNYEVNHE